MTKHNRQSSRQPILSPTEDLRFKKMLTSQAHLSVPQGFIRDFFGLEVPTSAIRIANGYDINTVRRAVAEGGRAVTELAATLRDVGFDIQIANLTIEMQIRASDTSIMREIHYLSRTYTDNYGKDRANPYASLVPVAELVILGHRRFPDDIAYRYQSLGDFQPPGYREPPCYLAPPPLWLGILELPKEPTDPGQKAWRQLIHKGQVSSRDPGYVREAAEIIAYTGLEPEEQAMIDLLEKARADRADELAQNKRDLERARVKALAEGHAQGVAEGHAEGRREMAEKLLRAGQSPEFVSELSGIPIAELLKM